MYFLDKRKLTVGRASGTTAACSRRTDSSPEISGTVFIRASKCGLASTAMTTLPKRPPIARFIPQCVMTDIGSQVDGVAPVSQGNRVDRLCNIMKLQHKFLRPPASRRVKISGIKTAKFRR